jgi:hypothetical protein
MEEYESRSSKNTEKRRFSQEQYDMLIRCSEKKDMSEWNDWRQQNPETDIANVISILLLYASHPPTMSFLSSRFVIPAKAGIYFSLSDLLVLYHRNFHVFGILQFHTVKPQ